jgi:hypothetical protein
MNKLFLLILITVVYIGIMGVEIVSSEEQTLSRIKFFVG